MVNSTTQTPPKGSDPRRHGAFSLRSCNIRRFNRLVSEIDCLVLNSDRRVFQIDRRVFPLERPTIPNTQESIGGENALWAKKLCPEAKETFNG